MVDVSILISVAGLLLAVLTFFVGRQTAAKSAGHADGEMKTDIKYIKRAQDELKNDVKQYGANYADIRAELESLKGRLAKLEEIIKIYHTEGTI